MCYLLGLGDGSLITSLWGSDPSLNWWSNASKPDQPVISSFVASLKASLLSVAEASEEEEKKKKNNQDQEQGQKSNIPPS